MALVTLIGGPIIVLNPRRFLSTLATELLLLIISLVDDRNDMLALCGTSVILRALSLPLFFKTIWLGQSDLRPYDQLERLYKSLKNPRIALMVTEFRVRIGGTCLRSTICGCDYLDEIVGEALQAMINLESLHIDCHLCQKPLSTVKGHHEYLDTLITPRLKSFAFQCLFCSGRCVDQRARILLSPCLANVKIFAYDPRNTPPVPDTAYTILDNPRVLSRVRVMQHYGTKLENTILAMRPIERLYVRYWRVGLLMEAGRLDSAILQSPGKLTHLILEESQYYTPRILQNLAIFIHLHHIGTFFLDENDPTLSNLEDCAALDNLISIDAVVKTDARNRWDKFICSRLRKCHPNLRKVLLHGASCCLWELRRELWVMRAVMPFTAWSVIQGLCDDL